MEEQTVPRDQVSDLATPIIKVPETFSKASSLRLLEEAEAGGIDKRVRTGNGRKIGGRGQNAVEQVRSNGLTIAGVDGMNRVGPRQCSSSLRHVLVQFNVNKEDRCSKIEHFKRASSRTAHRAARYTHGPKSFIRHWLRCVRARGGRLHRQRQRDCRQQS